MRTYLALSIASMLALSLAGCGYDPVGQCVSRCEEGKSEGCVTSATDCENTCVLADDTYEDNLDRAETAGCVSEYNTFVACYDSTPACATGTEIATMCGEEYLILENCW